ncbi:MAG: hypothetical protein AAF600_08625 [Bacteroidota bacterium]
MMLVEKELKLIHIRFDGHLAFIKERFEGVDKRFEDNPAFNKERFEAIDRQFEAIDKWSDLKDRNMKWLIGFEIAFLTFGYVIL